MKRVGQRDLETVLSYLRRVYAHRDLEGFASHLVATLPEIVPSESTAYHVFDPQNRTVTALMKPIMPDIAGAGEIFRQYAHEHPLLNHYRRTRDGHPRMISDFLTQRQFHRLGLYNELYKELETEHQMGFRLASPPFLIGVVLNRSSRDFSERDRLLLDALRPHLAQAYRNAESVTQMRQDSAHVRQAVEELDRGAISLTEKNLVRWWTGRTRAWMQEYFEPPRQMGHLPESLQRWVEHQRSLPSKDGDVPPPRQPLVVKRPGKRLLVRLVDESSNDRCLLVLEEQHAAFSASSIRSFGLTRREEEVLLWVARGKTDKEVAALLYISPRTVMKHLEHIYEKLGVMSRTEAIARVFEAISVLRG